MQQHNIHMQTYTHPMALTLVIFGGGGRLIQPPPYRFSVFFSKMVTGKATYMMKFYVNS